MAVAVRGLADTAARRLGVGRVGKVLGAQDLPRLVAHRCVARRVSTSVTGRSAISYRRGLRCMPGPRAARGY